MSRINAQTETFEEVVVFDQLGYFTDLRVDKDTIPEGLFYYEMRHGDDDSYPVSVERAVCVNYFGAVLFTRELKLDDNLLTLGYDDFGYLGNQGTLSELMGEKGA